jgi:arylsulfatase A-like enzyme
VRLRPREFLAVLALLALGACPAKPPPPDGPNVLIVAIDTLRADRLTCQGGPAGLTPRLDELAAQGVRFEAAFAHAPWTLPSFASLFTSLPPEAHGAGGNVKQGWRALDGAQDTLAERFRDRGWDTAAVVNVDFLTEPFGTVQGFEHVDARAFPDNTRVRRAGATTDAALAWIDQPRERPFLLLVHYFDVHAEYDPPPEWRARFALPQDRESTAFRFGTREHVVLHRAGRLPLDAATLARASALYDAEVAYVDSQVGRLLDGLRARGLDGRTVVVALSDHGEEFGDHGSWEHGHTHYDELLHVPLVVRAPGVAPLVVRAPVGLIDVAPTLCALAGVPPAPGFRGRDLTAALRGAAPAPIAGLSAYGSFWAAPLASWRTAEWKLVQGGAAPHLFAWTRDAREREDLAGARPDVVAGLAAQAQAERARLGADPPRVGPPVEVSAEAIERLGSYGYTGGDGHR